MNKVNSFPALTAPIPLIYQIYLMQAKLLELFSRLFRQKNVAKGTARSNNAFFV